MMLIKNEGQSKSGLTLFDMIGYKENDLSRAFAYVLANDREFFYFFINSIGINKRNTQNNYINVNIETEVVKANNGRTDIEIKSEDDYHIIIESKMDSNKVNEQRTKYFERFKEDTKQNIMCFITGQRDSYIFNDKDNKANIKAIYISWIDIINLIDEEKDSNKNGLLIQFLQYLKRSVSMNDGKDILIQDLDEDTEINRFENFQVYRRDEVIGNPLYFCPYYTIKNKANKPKGIQYISRILGILSFNPKEIDINIIESDLIKFSEKSELPDSKRNSLLDNWKEGIKLEEKIEKIFTYYFLDIPFSFKEPLLKDSKNGKGWLSSQISKNRKVSFIDLLKHIPELYREA